MPSMVWALLCERGVTDATSNNFTAVNVVEQLNLDENEKIPDDGKISALNLLPPLTLVGVISWVWPKDDGTSTATLSTNVRTGRGKKVTLTELATIPRDGKDRTRIHISIPSLPLDGLGTYVFDFVLNEKSAFKVPLDIKTMKIDPKAPVRLKGKLSTPELKNSKSKTKAKRS